MFEVGFSVVSLWRRCPKAYEYAEIRRLQAKRRPVPMLEGTILHEMLEAYYNALGMTVAHADAAESDPSEVLKRYAVEFRALLEEEREHYGEHFIENLGRIFAGYKRTWADEDWCVEATEETIYTPLTKDITFRGTVDLRVRTDKDDRFWQVDHKVKKVIPTPDQRFSNQQLLLYPWAWNREHSKAERVDGIIWNYLRRKAPTVPEVLKKGGLTQRADLDTDVFTYAKAISDNDLNPSDYADYLGALEKRSQNRFFERVPLPLPDEAHIDAVLEDFKHTAIMMKNLRVYPRNLTEMCPSNCQFFDLCRAELTGVDTKFVLKSKYEEREDDRYSEED